MADTFWILAGFSPILCLGTAVAVAKRRRRAWRGAANEAFAQSDDSGPNCKYLAPDIEAAERELGMVLRRMRAYRCAPYDFASSRIRNDAEFEHCLDLATALGLRIGGLSGASIDAPTERERIRDQILQSLSPRPNALIRASELALSERRAGYRPQDTARQLAEKPGLAHGDMRSAATPRIASS